MRIKLVHRSHLYLGSRKWDRRLKIVPLTEWVGRLSCNGDLWSSVCTDPENRSIHTNNPTRKCVMLRRRAGYPKRAIVSLEKVLLTLV